MGRGLGSIGTEIDVYVSSSYILKSPLILSWIFARKGRPFCTKGQFTIAAVCLEDGAVSRKQRDQGCDGFEPYETPLNVQSKKHCRGRRRR